MRLLSRRRLQTSLLQDAIEGAGRDILVRSAGEGDPPGLRRMLELLMTALRSGKVPTVIQQHAENVPNLHDRNNVRVRKAFGQPRELLHPERFEARDRATLTEA
jgi:hypothetical protein